MDEMNWEEAFENLPLPEDLFFQGDGDGDGDGASAIDLIEEYLMKEDDDKELAAAVSGDDLMWLDDILLDSPHQQEVVDVSPSSSPPLSDDKTISPCCSNSEAEAEGNVLDAHIAKINPTRAHPDADHNPNFENEKSSGDDQNPSDDDPLCKKRKRQLRNRDAAMRSRERKKVYVKDLEAKGRYLEAECRRLGRLLQCCYAENQMLRISLGSAYGASMAKPESAVLLLESLLLVSLVWLMVNMCLPRLPLLNQDAVPHASEVERKEQESAAPNGKGTMVTELWVTRSFVKSKRCKASRIKMKSDFDCAVPCF